MYMHYTVLLISTLYHKDQSSVSKKAAKKDDLKEKWTGDLQQNYSSGQKYGSFFHFNH